MAGTVGRCVAFMLLSKEVWQGKYMSSQQSPSSHVIIWSKTRLLSPQGPAKHGKQQSLLSQGFLHDNFFSTLHFGSSRQHYLHSLFIVSLISLVSWKILWQKNAETTGSAEKTALSGEEPVNLSGVFLTSSETLCRKHSTGLRDWEGAD